MLEFYGIIGVNKGKEASVVIQIDGQVLKDKDSVYIHNVRGKFTDDEIVFENEAISFYLKGFILNKSYLQSINPKLSLPEILLNEYSTKGNQIWNQIRGSFVGCIIYKDESRCILFTDQFGNKQLFYSMHSGYLFFGSKVSDITALFKKNKLLYHVDEGGVGCILQYGFMLEDYTLVQEIKKLQYGCCLEITANNLVINRYWNFDNTTFTNDREEDILEHVNLLFRNAVKMEFEKDEEYNYKHFVTLSSGLDSRMVAFVANELGFKKQTNFTYSRHLYTDQTVAQTIADDLGHSFIFSLMNDQNFFNDYAETIKLTSGNCLISGIISGYNALVGINLDRFGIAHTGQLGDVVLGTYNKTASHIEMHSQSGSFSKNQFSIAPKINFKDYPNNEYFMLTQRGFNGILQGNLLYQQSGEVYSPFLDMDFFEYCMSIPPELRFNHNIYIKWIRKYYPPAANYTWDKIMAPLSGKIFRYNNILLPTYNFLHLRKSLLPRIGKISKKLSFLAEKHSMTPQQYWFENNLSLQQEINSSILSSNYFNSHNDNINEIIAEIINSNDFTKISQVLTVTEALKLLFD